MVRKYKYIRAKMFKHIKKIRENKVITEYICMYMALRDFKKKTVVIVLNKYIRKN